MAELVFSELVKFAVEKLGSKVCKTVADATDIESQIKGIQDIKATLEATLLDAADSDSSKQLCTRSQRDVLEKLQCGLAKLIDFQDAKAAKAKQKELMGGSKFTKEVRLFFSSSNQLVSPFKDARKIRGITGELSNIVRNHAQFGSIVSSSTFNQTRTLSNDSDSYMCNEMVVGRDGDKDNMVSMLLNPPASGGDDHISVASMVGIGGIGKTTLAKYVFDDQRIVTYFDLRLWASTNQDFDVKDLLRQIVGGSTDDGHSEGTIRQLLARLSGAVAGKRFLLVLDGVWDADLLSARFGDLKGWLRVGALGSQILVTTRSDTVAKMIGTQDPYMISELGDDDSWLLFKRYAITQWHEPGVEVVGRKIAKMCHNVPLVIRAIGSLLAGKFTVREWSAFWNDEFAKFASYGRSVMDTLKVSYDHLSPNLKLCVAYCSLFPKGFEYQKNHLIHLWIAMGYVKKEYSNQSIEDAAEDYVLCLLERGFFHYKDNYKDEFMMHNLIHELVLSVAGFKYKMADSNTDEFDERVYHVSFESAPTSSWNVLSSLLKVKRLESILFSLPGSNSYEHEKVRVVASYDESTFKSLRVLGMHELRIDEMPSSVGKLIHLRYLDFSKNPIRKLPDSITKLVYLYFLDLQYCRELEELPEDINKLASLRHLNLEDCDRLRYMPKKLTMLTDLETLGRFVVGKPSGSKADLACNLADLGCFKNLKGSLTVVRDRSRDTVLETHAVNLSLNKITDFSMEFSGNLIQDETVLENLKPCPHLESLNIKNYAGRSFPLWMREGIHLVFSNLVRITISGSQECIYVCSFGRLPHLRYIHLENLEKVEYIENGDDCSNNNDNTTMVLANNKHASTPLFPSLVDIYLVDIPNLKGWRSVTDFAQEKPPPFPKLEGMEIEMESVIKLAKTFLPTISSLQSLYVKGKPGEVVSGQTTCGPSSSNNVVVLLKNYLPMLRRLSFSHKNQMRVLPEEFRGMSSLENLIICACEAFEALPGWIDTLTSLTSLYMHECPRLKSFPHEISNLSKLKALHLVACSWELAERCQAPSGEDWPKIQHIPIISIEPAANND